MKSLRRPKLVDALSGLGLMCAGRAGVGDGLVRLARVGFRDACSNASLWCLGIGQAGLLHVREWWQREGQDACEPVHEDVGIVSLLRWTKMARGQGAGVSDGWLIGRARGV